MDFYMKLIFDYNEYYNNRLNMNKDKLIESFVIYYGEEYRNIITERFNKIIFTWFLSDYTQNIYKDYICKNITDKRIEHTNKILNILGYEQLNINNIKNGNIIYKNNSIFPGEISSVYCKNKKIDNILKYLFGKNNIFNYNYDSKLYNFFSLKEKDKIKLVKKVFKTKNIDEEILNKIESVINYMNSIEKDDDIKYIDFAIFSEYLKCSDIGNKIICTSNDILFTDEWKYTLEQLNNMIEYFPLQTTLSPDYNIIMLPMLYSNDCELIHEINHSITSSVIANLGSTKIPISKTGLSNSFDNEVGLEELLNEMSTLEITKIFNNLGGNVLDDKNYKIPLVGLYEKALPLVMPFYNKYKDIIKKARITENSNILYKYIDKNKYLEFKTFINDVINKIEDRINNTKSTICETDSFTKDEEYSRAYKLISEMNKDVSVEMDIKEYAELLRKEGKKVSIINHDDIEINNRKKI